ncbi:MAG TPA: NAD(P)-binding domain-containing protein [Bacteroidales bacterium]|nr:NAD(P)-binding domain-containing protein [Bacteroidales bacterium]
MITKSLGFIGGGRVTKIFLQAFRNRSAEFRSISVYDTNPEVLTALKNQFPAIFTFDSVSLVAKQDIVFIALHPPVIMDTLEKIQDDVSPVTIIISLAPKINIEKIEAKLNRVTMIVRVIPNATSFINEGYNPVCFNKEFPAPEKQLLQNMLGLLGHTFEVTENKLEGYAIMSAMLPTYFWFQWKELQSIGIQMGLDEEECRDSIYKTLIASLNLMYESGLSVSEVMDLIPVKPIAEHEDQIKACLKGKLLPLFEKIKP